MNKLAIFIPILSLCCVSFVQAADIEAGPIWSNTHAQERCPEVCTGQNMVWNGHWLTTVWGKMSVCNCQEASVSPVTEPPIAVENLLVEEPPAPPQSKRLMCAEVCVERLGPSYTGVQDHKGKKQKPFCRCFKKGR